MRTIVVLMSVLFAAACNDAPATARYVDAITGEACDLDPGSYMPRDPTAPDPRVDCTHHDDVEPPGGHCCEFPQPGCDRNGCCDVDVVVPDPDPEPGSGSGSGSDGPVVI
jgi:hypothetical protein